MKTPTRIRHFCLAWLAVVSAFQLEAVPVTIADPSFEGNSITVNGYTYDLSPDWTGTDGPNSGNAFEEYITGFAAQGTDHLGMEPNYEVWQDLTAVYQANTRYTLTVATGNRGGNTSVGNNSQYFLANSSGTIFASGSLDASTLTAGSFADAPALVFDTPTTSASVGQVIRILLQSGGNGRSHFDHIRLDAVQLTPSGTASVGNLNATAVTSTSATLNGTVTAIGNGAPSVTIFWGPGDGGISPAAWQNSISLTGSRAGMFSASISSLDPATTYRFTVRATNSAGESWVTPSAALETSPAAPSVANTSVSDITSSSATLGANVTSTGGEEPTVTIYYGPADGGMNPQAWASSADLGTGSGPMSGLVSGLSAATTYYFRAFAQNSGGQTWAPESLNFSTLTITSPSVENRATEGITGTTANVHGEITRIGGNIPSVTLFYGTTDGGILPNAWTYSATLGPQANEFSRFISNLSPNTIYFLRWRAVNPGGTSWSEASDSFTTTGLFPGTAVITEFHYNSADRTSFEEFIELHNPGDAAIDLSGWTLSDAVSFTFPAGTSIPVGGYLVVGQNPAVLSIRFGITGAHGPWTGNLSAQGERIDLRDAAGVIKDRVGYGVGFPWPTAADGTGSSAELVNPSLDNDLGGSWRSSGTFAETATVYIASQATGWKYKKGTAEASTPVDAWRAVAYNDSAWLTGQAEIGYKNNNSTYAKTTLGDMYGVYSSVYFRKNFTIPSGSVPQQLNLRIHIDDGCIIWINGREVARKRVAAGQVAYNAYAGNHERAWEEITITNADTFLLGGTNVIAVHGFNTRIDSSDFSMNLELSSVANLNTSPTPGLVNTVNRAIQAIPPQIRQVAHSPNSPLPNTPVTITARITDPNGVALVNLAYQSVNPGAYVRKTDTTYASSWTSVSMTDNGTGGDAVAGDSIYTTVLPASLQTHRGLVRYRISFADSSGNSQSVPYTDDEQPNFAYFTYGGVPAWSGAFIPGSSTPQTYASSFLESMSPLHIIANAADVNSLQAGSASRFYATVIQRGVVHDHVQFRVRGIGSTTVSGKEKWNIYFNRARDYQAYDNYGKPYKETWSNLLINANSSPWAAVNRGSAGVEEAVSNRIFSLAGMAAMNTHYLHLRVIDNSVETSPTDQFSGDLWGLYLGLEPTEGNFLNERGMEDGNLYSIEGSGGDKKHQGATQPVDTSDWTSFNNAANLTGQTEQWYRDNVDLPSLYTFLALNRLIGNVDVRPGDNYRFFHRPSDNRWVIIPYDLDMQFIAAHHWGGSMDGVIVAGAPNVIRAISRHPNIAREYRNRCREILSLIGSDGTSTGGQIGQLIDEYAQIVNPTGVAQTWADLDAAMWNLNPRTAGTLGALTGQSNHKGNFYRATYYDGSRGAGGTTSTTSWIRSIPDPDGNGYGDHEGMMQWYVNYATNTWPGGTWNRKAMTGIGSGTDTDMNRQKGYGYKYLEFESLHGGWVNSNANPGAAANTDYPNKPFLTATGDPAFKLNNLAFQSSAFKDPQGAGTYAAWQWRVAQIAAPGVPGYLSGSPRRYEIEPVMTTAELTGAPGSFTIPLGVVETGKTYRIRARHKDSAGNWSYWSDPIQFAATAPELGLAHYWNFNTTSSLLVPTVTTGGGTISIVGTYEAGTGQNFAAANARNADAASSHLRVNNPLTAGTMITAAIPSTGFENIIIQYETRRSAVGAGTQTVSYTLDGSLFLPFTTLTISDATPQVGILDFRAIPAADNNSHFGIRITFDQGAGGTAGNNRFDNLTVEGDVMPPGFELWKTSSFPNAADLVNETVSGPNANPSGDGVANLIRYALGAGPFDPVRSLLPVLGKTNSAYVFRFRFDPTKTDLIWRVRASNNLSDWSHVLFDSQTSALPPLDNGWLPVTLPAHLGAGPAADPQIFTRLEVERVSN